MKKKESALLPCPFCGAKAKDVSTREVPDAITCSNGSCNLGMHAWLTTAQWNSRKKKDTDSFDQYQQSLAVLMAENEALNDKVNDTEGIVNLAFEIIRTNMDMWHAANIGDHQAEILNRLSAAVKEYARRQNG